jgi:hypothetical protein
MKKRVICWSGGPDSTLALMELLRDTEDPITAVTFGRMKTPSEQSALLRMERLQRILTERFREFEWVRKPQECWTGTYSIMRIGTFVREVMPMLDGGTLYPVSWGGEFDKRSEWIGPLVQDVIGPRIEVKIGGDRYRTKAGIRRALGDLWEITWSCRGAEKLDHPCGECSKCEERQIATEES